MTINPSLPRPVSNYSHTGRQGGTKRGALVALLPGNQEIFGEKVEVASLGNNQVN